MYCDIFQRSENLGGMHEFCQSQEDAAVHRFHQHQHLNVDGKFYFQSWSIINLCLDFVQHERACSVIYMSCFIGQDLHCHLTTSEVIGYLAGRWHEDTHRK